MKSMADIGRVWATSEQDALAIEDVLDAAQEWEVGMLPLGQALRVGDIPSGKTGLPSPAWTRAMAERTTRGTDDPRRECLLRMIDAALTTRNRVITPWGVFDRRDIERHSEGFDMEQVRNRLPSY